MMMGALAGAHPLQVGDDGLVHQRPVSVDGPEMGGEATAAGAVHAAMYACAALVRAKTTGQGAFIDVAASDATLVNAWLPVVLQRNDSRVTDRSGSAQRSEGELSGARYQFYQTKDGKLVLFGCIEQRFWTVFCDLIDRPDLATRGNEGGTEDVAWGGEDPSSGVNSRTCSRRGRSPNGPTSAPRQDCRSRRRTNHWPTWPTTPDQGQTRLHRRNPPRRRRIQLRRQRRQSRRTDLSVTASRPGARRTHP